LGYAAFTFTVGGFASWAPKYLIEVRNVPLAQADTWFGALTVVAGFSGSIIGGFGAAWLLKKKKSGDIWFAVIAIALSIPFAFLSFILQSRWGFYTSMGLCEFFLFMSQPPIIVVTLESVGYLLRGTASALCVFTIHLLGDFISPPLIGFMADKFSLEKAVFLSPVALFLALFFYWQSYKSALRVGGP
jgi:fucose permease